MVTFEEFLSKKDENMKECEDLIEILQREYDGDCLKQNNHNICEEILKVVEIERETLIALLQEKQEILSNLKYDNYHTIIEAFEEKEEQIYRQFCTLRKIVYEANSKTLELQSKSEELFFNIKYRRNNKNFMQAIKDKMKWFVRHYNIGLMLFSTIGIFISCTYFFYIIGYFPRLNIESAIVYFLFITIIGIMFSLVFCIFLIIPILIIDEIFKKIKRVKGKEFWFFMGLLIFQLSILVFLFFIFNSPTLYSALLYLLSMFIFPVSFWILNKHYNIFYFYNNNKSLRKNIDFYILLFLLVLCILYAYFFTIFVLFQSNIVEDKYLMKGLFIGLLFLFVCFITFLIQEKFNPIKVGLSIFAVIFWYFAFCLTPNVFQIVYLGNYKLEFLTLDIQAKDFINKNCLKQIKQGDTSDTIVVSDVKVLLNIGEEYRLQMQCDSKSVDFSIPSRFIKDNKEKLK